MEAVLDVALVVAALAAFYWLRNRYGAIAVVGFALLRVFLRDVGRAPPVAATPVPAVAMYQLRMDDGRFRPVPRRDIEAITRERCRQQRPQQDVAVCAAEVIAGLRARGDLR
jgi:hypothetical protein